MDASRNRKNYDFIWKKKNLNKNYRLALDHMSNSLKKIVNFAKNKRVKVAIETEGSIKKRNLLLMQKPAEYKELFKYFKPNDLGVNLNIGHLNLASKAFKFSKFEFVKELKQYILAMELSHNNGIEDQHLPLLSDGWYWSFIQDTRFIDVFKIMEFRNTTIEDVVENIKLFNSKVYAI